MKNYLIFKAEYSRFALFGLLTFFIGLLTNYWVLAFAISLFLYLIVIFYQLQKTYNWLKTGSDENQKMQLDGAFELIHYEIENSLKQKLKGKGEIESFYSRFQNIVKNLPYAVILINQNNEIDWINNSAETLLGFDGKKDKGQKIENLLRDPKLHSNLEKNSHEEFEVNSPISIRYKLSMQLIVLSQNLKALIARDITEYSHIQEVRKNYISNASHELRTPLTVISGYLEMLKIDKNLPSSYSNIIKASFEQSIRMKNIVEGLLTLSTLEGKEPDLSEISEKIEVNFLLNRIISEQEKLHKQVILKNINSSIGIIGCEIEMISLFTNLIHNALIHNPKNTKIEVLWELTKKGAQFIVKDEGIGIASQHLPHLTDRFYRVKNENENDKTEKRSEQVQGTGLGLCITNLIAKRHNLKLSIKSEVGKGSVFKVKFPNERVYQMNDKAIKN